MKEIVDRKFKILAVNPITRKHHTEEDSLLLCAKDKAVPAALLAYANECELIGANQEHINSVYLLRKRVLDFQDQLGSKVPDSLGEEIVNQLRSENICDAGVWIKTIDLLPTKELLGRHAGSGVVDSSHADCYIVVDGRVLKRPYNFHHECWDREDYDDFEFEATRPTHWMLAKPLPKPPAED